MSSFKIFVDNDDLIWLRGFQDDITELYENASATVTMEILELDNTEVQASGAMTYDTGSDGDFYRGVDDGTPLVVGVEYKAKVIATSASGVKSTFIHKFVAEERIG